MFNFLLERIEINFNKNLLVGEVGFGDFLNRN